MLMHNTGIQKWVIRIFSLVLACNLVRYPCVAQPQPADRFTARAEATLEAGIISRATAHLTAPPVTITAFTCARSAGGKHDFYSEGDYWWPDSAHPDSPYVQRDGQTNPANFTAHRIAMIRFSEITGNLAAAFLVTGDEKYVRAAIPHFRAWFTDTATLMKPSLNYAQAIQGRYTGRGIGIIDGIQLMEAVRAVQVMARSPAMDPALVMATRGWVSRFLQWLTTHRYGLAEMNAANNHGTCWVMQVGVYAVFTGNDSLQQFCRERFKSVLLPGQLAVDGSFPLELRRTKPYGYSIFNLDAMAAICQVLSTTASNLWEYATPGGQTLRDAISFLYPFLADKSKWPFAHDVMFWDQWPVAQPALVFGARAYRRPDWLATWEKLDHYPDNPEVIRNLPIRNPLIWMTGSTGKDSTVGGVATVQP